MGTYVLRRVLAVVPVLLIISFLVVAMLRIVPGDPAQIIAGDFASKEQVEQVRVNLGLDRPVWEQYVRFVANAAAGDLGRSYQTRRTVVQELGVRLPYTAQLAVCAMAFAIVVGLAAGILAGVRQNTFVDNAIMVVVVIGYSLPTFWLGLLFILLFSVNLNWLPVMGHGTALHLVMPALTLGLHPAAVIARLTRGSMIEVINLDYIRTAWAKGLAPATIVLRHALKNALIPVVTVIGLQFGSLLGGAVIVEAIFNWPGIGTLAIQAIRQRDYQMVQGVVLVAAFTFVMVNLLIDLLYGWLDPRIRYGQA